jgi:hypothetical protein
MGALRESAGLCTWVQENGEIVHKGCGSRIVCGKRINNKGD